MALVAEEPGWGLFRALAAPAWLGMSSVVLLDLAIYLQHVLFHAVPVCGACTGCTTPTSNST